MPFDLRRSLLPPTIAHRRPPNLPRTTAIASSKRISTNSGQKKAAVAAKALDSESIIPDSQSKVGANVLAITILRPAVTREPWWLKVEMFIERMDERSSPTPNCKDVLYHDLGLGYIAGHGGHLPTVCSHCSCGVIAWLKLVLRMLVVGTVMLSIGVGLYVMFGGSKDRSADVGWLVPGFHLQGLPTWMQMQTVSQAKSKMGQAILKTLQVGLLEKLADVTMASGLDLACIAGTVAVSSATVFLISRLSVDGRILQVT
ncbi:hypothetical protein ACLOJK_002939 [Asimina triloba]